MSAKTLTITATRYFTASDARRWSDKARAYVDYVKVDAPHVDGPGCEEVVAEALPTEGMTAQQVRQCFKQVRYTVKGEMSRWSSRPRYEVSAMSSLARDASRGVVTAENADALWAILAPVFDVTTSVPGADETAVIKAVLAAKGWSGFEGNFVIEYNQEAWGFMGGTGCGTLIHSLRFDKVVKVLPELTGVRRDLVTLWFSHMLGQVKAVRAEHAHLRNTVTADKVFVTLNAHPICQSTVAYHAAYGYPVDGATPAHCSCSKCAAKLKIPCASSKAVAAIKTPDSIEVDGFRLTYQETKKQGPKSQTRGTSKLVSCVGVRVEALDGAALQTRKAFNAEVKERGQGSSYDAPNHVDGIYYVEALANVVDVVEGQALFIKTGERTKDRAFEVAKRVVAAKMLLAK